MPIKPEIMSPAGYFPQLHAAVEAGADAVYFGLKHFTARAKVGFPLEELPDAMRALHSRGVKGYVTFNTLIFDHELSQAARTVEAIAAAGADSIIVQDVGMAALARRIAPDLAIHGSTQMSITSAEGVALAQRFGVNRVVLARELSLKDIRAIREATDCELEIFVHGALCVSYSGQCFSSEAWGGRSANRGKCAQACRLPYDLLVDDRVRPLGDARYLLSPGDLYALEQVPEIIDIGVHTLKIEGRYKDVEYVALTTRAYREAVDAAWSGRPSTLTPADAIAIEQVYSRGLGPHFIAGTNHQTVVSGRSPRHRGVLIGRVTRVQDDRAVIEPTSAHAIAPLKPGDGVVFDAADWRSPQEREEGGAVWQVEPAGAARLEIRFASRAIDFGRVRVGDWLWRTHDVDTVRAAKPYLDPAAPVQRQPVTVHVTAHVGQPLKLVWTLLDRPGVTATVRAESPLDRANARGATVESLFTALDRLGNTAYRLHTITADLDGEPFIPASLINRLRQSAVESLAGQQAAPIVRALHDPDAALHAALLPSPTEQSGLGEGPGVGVALPMQARESGLGVARLHLLVRTPDQLDAALAARPASITLDYLELYGLRPAVERIRESGIVPRVASPRVLKPHEQRVVNFLLRLDCAILVRSGGLLEALQGRHAHPLIADFSLNAANQLTAQRYFDLGVAMLTPTHDLNADQIARLATAIGGERFEVIAWHHLPVFHTEHCVFCRFLSNGTSYENCGHPCERHKVALRDEQGRAHPVMADVGCRNTVFGAEAQSGARHLAAWRAAGVRDFRLEFVHETGDQVARAAGAFAAHLAGTIPVAELERRLSAAAPSGTTEGSFFVPEGYLNIPVIG